MLRLLFGLSEGGLAAWGTGGAGAFAKICLLSNGSLSETNMQNPAAPSLRDPLLQVFLNQNIESESTWSASSVRDLCSCCQCLEKIKDTRRDEKDAVPNLE